MFDMIAAKFVDGPVGLAQGNDRVMTAAANHKVPNGVKPTRRIVCLDKEPNKSTLASDAATPDVRTDRARPGYASQRLWVTDDTPAKIVLETLHLPHALTPPKNGSIMRTVTFPPDASWQGKVGQKEVAAFFQAMGSPQASTWSVNAKHPYMQKTETLEFAVVTDGEMVQVEKILKFNRKALRRLGKVRATKADPRLVGGEDTMIVPVGKPGSRERVEALRSQYEAIVACGEEISPFSWKGE